MKLSLTPSFAYLSQESVASGNEMDKKVCNDIHLLVFVNPYRP